VTIQSKPFSLLRYPSRNKHQKLNQGTFSQGTIGEVFLFSLILGLFLISPDAKFGVVSEEFSLLD
jgi:hypothetical protein